MASLPFRHRIEPHQKPRRPNPHRTSPSPSQETLILTEKLRSGVVAGRTIQITKGDTLWGLSQRYGVPVEDIREVNGITGGTIYAGKKLIIP